jgi:5,10-methylenetetrahydrofolate reductase
MGLELLEKINTTGKPLLCLEINPPRGTDLAQIFARLEGNLKGLNFLNITDSALAKMRMSSIIFASLLKQRFGVEPLVNFTCRDKNVIAIQSELLGAWALDIRSIIALTGDAVSIGDMPEAKGVFEINSIGLLNIIEKLKTGKDLAENVLHGSPHYIAGSVVNPNVKNINAEIKRLARKKDSGAKYALSQPVFDEESSETFFKAAASVGINIFMGLLAFKSGRSALAISKIPGIKLPQRLLDLAEKSPDEDFSKFSLDHCMKLAEINKRHVQGFHVVSGATPKLALELCGRLADYIEGSN